MNLIILSTWRYITYISQLLLKVQNIFHLLLNIGAAHQLGDFYHVD